MARYRGKLADEAAACSAAWQADKRSSLALMTAFCDSAEEIWSLKTMKTKDMIG